MEEPTQLDSASHSDRPGKRKKAKPREGLFDRRTQASLKVPSIAVRIVDAVLARLLRKDARAGDFLGTEAGIAAAFQASRFPVREALSRLEALGLVEIRRGLGGGVCIAGGNPNHFAELLAVHFLLAEITPLELFEARLAIVPKVVEHATLHATAQDISELRRLLDTVENRRGEFDVALQALLDFYLKLGDLSKLRTLTALNRTLVYMMQDLYRTHVPPVLSGSPKKKTYVGLTNLRHVVDEMEKGDAKRAGEVSYNAISVHRDAILAQVAKSDV